MSPIESLTQHKFWYLNQINLFSGFREEEIKAIAEKMFDKHCAKKEVLYTPFDKSDTIFILKKGEVSLYSSYKGKKLIIDTLKPGSIFGNISFKADANTHFAEVTEDAYICILDKASFQKIIQEFPELMMRLIEIMSEKITDYENRMKGGLLDAKEKIIHYLKILETKNKQSVLARLFRTKNNLTHNQLAHHTGLSRETVTRAIQALKREGKINTGKQGEIII